MKRLTLTEVAIGLVIVGVLCLAVFGTGCDQKNRDDTSQKEMKLTEKNQARLLVSHPPPALTESQERVNLIKRLTRFNNANKISYIYLIDYGRVMAYYTIKGKVSSVNSLLTTPDQIVDDPFGGWDAGGRVVPSPDLDGSYGSNGDAVFFFTTEDVYVEWSGRYMLSDQPLHLSQEPLLIRQVDG